MTALAPGKIILSGEHSVVHGAPALAMAVSKFATASVTLQQQNLVSFDILNLSYHKAHTLDALRRLKHRLSEDYQKFLSGHFSIKDVLKKPFELSQYALIRFLDKLNLSPQCEGIKLSTHSEIPMGCGMGSSAAMILSVMHALREHFKIEINQERFFSYGLEIENLQHGASSGLDLRISLQGGCLHYEKGIVEVRPVPSIPMYLVNSGKPLSNTGECVAHTKSFFQENDLLQQFSDVTHQVDNALIANNVDDLKTHVKQNHQLLIKIGVVPAAIQHFIAKLEQHGAAAKVCGAGSIHGNHAGMILIISEQDPSALCTQYGFNCSLIQGEKHGLRTV